MLEADAMAGVPCEPKASLTIVRVRAVKRDLKAGQNTDAHKEQNNQKRKKENPWSTSTQFLHHMSTKYM